MILSYRGESQPLLLSVLAALSVGCASMTDDRLISVLISFSRTGQLCINCYGCRHSPTGSDSGVNRSVTLQAGPTLHGHMASTRLFQRVSLLLMTLRAINLLLSHHRGSPCRLLLHETFVNHSTSPTILSIFINQWEMSGLLSRTSLWKRGMTGFLLKTLQHP